MWTQTRFTNNLYDLISVWLVLIYTAGKQVPRYHLHNTMVVITMTISMWVWKDAMEIWQQEVRMSFKITSNKTQWNKPDWSDRCVVCITINVIDKLTYSNSSNYLKCDTMNNTEHTYTLLMFVFHVKLWIWV